MNSCDDPEDIYFYLDGEHRKRYVDLRRGDDTNYRALVDELIKDQEKVNADYDRSH